MNVQDILSKPAFTQLEPERAAALVSLLQQMENKNPMECLSLISDFQKKMPHGREFSKTELDAMLDTILESMNDTERQKFSQIVKIMKTFSK